MKCLVCDDHALVRDALAMTLTSLLPDADIETASDFDEAWDRAQANSFNLVLCDFGMPGASGLEGLSRMRALTGQTPLIVITGQEDDATLVGVLGLGVQGFIPKTAQPAIIEAAIALVLAGGQYLPPRLLALSAQVPPPPATTIPRKAATNADGMLGRLTDRQTDVLRLLCEGFSNKEIARALEISPSTVKSHVAHVIACLGATNRTEAAMRAREHGII